MTPRDRDNTVILTNTSQKPRTHLSVNATNNVFDLFPVSQLNEDTWQRRKYESVMFKCLSGEFMRKRNVHCFVVKSEVTAACWPSPPRWYVPPVLMARGEAERAAEVSSPSIVSMAKLSLATKRIACHWPSLRPEPGEVGRETETNEFHKMSNSKALSSLCRWAGTFG